MEVIEKKALDEKELQLMNTLMNLFSERHAGRDKAAKTDDIIFHLKAIGYGSVHPQTLRAVIGYIRQNDLLAPSFILSNVHVGYWLSSNISEQEDFINQELNRMSNQYNNVRLLHERIRNGKKKTDELQTRLF